MPLEPSGKVTTWGSLQLKRRAPPSGQSSQTSVWDVLAHVPFRARSDWSATSEKSGSWNWMTSVMGSSSPKAVRRRRRPSSPVSLISTWTSFDFTSSFSSPRFASGSP